MTPPISEIKIDRRARSVIVVGDDGHDRVLDATQLRRACPCAQCRLLRRQGCHVEPVERVQVEQLQSMGYGVQIGFSDGHARGIYPWRYLLELASGAPEPDGEHML